MKSVSPLGSGQYLEHAAVGKWLNWCREAIPLAEERYELYLKRRGGER